MTSSHSESDNSGNNIDKCWKPSVAIVQLQARARLYRQIRAFFQKRQVLEVETPILANAFSLEPNIKAVMAYAEPLQGSPNSECLGYLQSSPEFHMKRLLAAGAGDIYQITKAFRASEIGRRHNTEFSMLEWYRVGWTYRQLMQEVEALLSPNFGGLSFERLAYGALFETFTQINPHISSKKALEAYIKENLSVSGFELATKSDCLDLIFSHMVEPHIGASRPIIVCDYPACQSELAEIDYNDQGYEVALRFEVFFKGVELGNGYQELIDCEKFSERLRDQQSLLKDRGLDRPLDDLLLKAVVSGLPRCAGISLGLDRVLMLTEAIDSISETLTFSSKNA